MWDRDKETRQSGSNAAYGMMESSQDENVTKGVNALWGISQKTVFIAMYEWNLSP